MKTFIRVVELWVPDRTRTRLEFGGSLCSSEFSEFRALSENTLFAYGEGLPGKAWASRHPIVLTEFSNSYFKRTDEPKEVGLTCGVALPVFAGEFLMAVMVLFCGDDDKHVGAAASGGQPSAPSSPPQSSTTSSPLPGSRTSSSA
jgi:hypothetical protein